MRWRTRSFFRLLKKDSATALSQQLPRRLMLGSRLLERQKRRQSSLPYCVPWSECTRTQPCGLRRHNAIRSASRTSSRASVGFIDQPTILRACKATTTARYNRARQVRLYVISVSQALAGASTVHSRLSREGPLIDG